MCDGFAVGMGQVFSHGADAMVVKRRLAAHHQLNGAAYAEHRAQQDVLGVLIHRDALVIGARSHGHVPHNRHVPHD